ncbi:MAG TPA: HAD family hydrolase [Thermoplasmata archaeon]|nr:HAD family hydrolase [Thermoplasmata archaeon]
MRVRAVLFDLGGTLVDEKDYDGWAELARRVYLDLDPDNLRHAFLEVEGQLDADPYPGAREDRLVDFWQRTLSRAASKPVDAATTRRFMAAVREAERPVRLYSDARRCLDILHSERRSLGVISNSTSEAAVRRILDRVGILDYFDRILSSGTEGIEKPDPEIFRRAVRRMAVRPEEAVFVGNLARTDAKAAEAAGLHGVWLNREGFGYGEDPPEITSLLEVSLVIRRLEASGEAHPKRETVA